MPVVAGRDAIKRLGEDKIRASYGNLFQMYEKIAGENPYERPMMIYPAVHYTMGGLWVDYNLMSNVPGLFVLGEANFSDHGANRLGASALMQGLADGYFVIPYTVGDYLAGQKAGSRPSIDAAEFKAAEENVTAMSKRFLGTKGKQPVSHFHKRLGKIMWEHCGMARTKASLEEGIKKIAALREEYWKDVKVLGSEPRRHVLQDALAPHRVGARQGHVQDSSAVVLDHDEPSFANINR